LIAINVVSRRFYGNRFPALTGQVDGSIVQGGWTSDATGCKKTSFNIIGKCGAGQRICPLAVSYDNRKGRPDCMPDVRYRHSGATAYLKEFRR